MNLLRSAWDHDGELDTADTLADHGRDSEERTHERSIPFDLHKLGDGEIHWGLGLGVVRFSM